MIPVVITHRGNQDYFHDVIRQALSYNERVILIGDDSNRNTPGVEHFLGRELYTSEIELFENSYVHMHLNPSLAYRCACITRWFLIAEIAKRLDLPMLFACDSDLMLYTSVEEPEQRLGEYDLACSIPVFQPEFRWSASGHVSYWKRDMLFEFCKFVSRTYSSLSRLAHLGEKWDWHRKTDSPGGICDMTLLWLFIQEGIRTCIDLCSPVEGTVFDHNFNEAGGYRTVGNTKEIEWRNNQPYSFHMGLRSWIRFNALHFQGPAKRVLTHYFRPK